MGKCGNSDRLYFLGLPNSEDGDFSHEIKRYLLLGRKAMTNLDSLLKIRDITLPTKVHIVKGMVFPVVMYWCESWTINKAEYQRMMLLNCGVEDSWEFLGLPGDPTVTRVYVPRFFVLSQQRFGVTDIKAPSACRSSQVLDRPCYSSQVSNGPCIALRQISVTAQCYSSILFRR